MTEIPLGRPILAPNDVPAPTELVVGDRVACREHFGPDSPVIPAARGRIVGIAAFYVEWDRPPGIPGSDAKGPATCSYHPERLVPESRAQQDVPTSEGDA